MKNFEFKSAICTSRSQSERLLKLGLKRETADMVYIPHYKDEGYLYRDLHNGEVLPHIFNCPCRWIVQEETIEPVGFHIAQWIKVEDRLPEYNTPCLVRTSYGTYRAVEYIARCNSDKGCFVSELGILYCDITHWMPIIPPKED